MHHEPELPPRNANGPWFMCSPCKLPHHGNIPSPFAALDVRLHPGPILQNVALAVEGFSTLQPMALLRTRQGGQGLQRRALMLSPPGNPPQLITGLKGALSIRLHIRYVTSRGSGRIEKDADEQKYKVGPSCEGPTRPATKPKEAR